MADIFATDPYGRQVNRPGLFSSMMGSANATMDLFNKGYQNQQEAAKAQYAQNTLGDSIAAANAKNQADTQYYPQQQMYKTQQEAATIKEIQARTGLSYSQAREVGARTGLINTQRQMLTDPSMTFDTLYKKLQTLPQGSPERKYISSQLTGMLNGAGVPTVGGGKKTSAGGLLPSMGAQGGMQVNPLETSRSGFKQGFTLDQSGNPITMESPTTASGTRNQMRGEAEQESKYISPTILNGVNNYQGMFPTVDLLKDSYTARFGAKKAAEAAKQRLGQYALASKFIPEAASINARQATGQAPGIELVREFTSKMFPNMPSDFATAAIPADIKIKANNAYPNLQQGMADQAINESRAGYPQEGTPAWATSNNPYPNGMIDESGNYIPPQQAAPQQAPQPSAQQESVQIPKFNSRDDFRAWFQLQPLDKQAQILAQLPKAGS